MNVKNILLKAESENLFYALVRPLAEVGPTLLKDTGDIDIFIRGQDFETWHSYLNENSYYRIPDTTVYATFDQNLVIDLHVGACRRAPYLDEYLYVRNSHLIEGLRFVSEQMLFLIALLHPLDLAGVNGFRRYKSEKLSFIESHTYLISDTVVVETLISNFGKVGARLLCLSLKKKLASIRFYSWVIKVILLVKSRLARRELGRRICARFRVKPKPLIVVLGVDGAGKSTLIDGLTREFNRLQAGPLAKVIYMGFLGGYRLPIASFARWYTWFRDKRVKVETELDKRPQEVSSANANKNGALAYWVKSFFISFEFILRYLVIQRWRYFGGRVVVADRYVYDNAREDLGGKLFAWVERIAPRPSNIIFLKGDANLFYSRKGEYDPEVLEGHQSKILSSLDCAGIDNVKIIDASKPILDVLYAALISVNAEL